MKALIDTVFNPILGWLSSIADLLSDMSVPASRGLDLSNYIGFLAYFGKWSTVFTTLILFLFIYSVTYVLVAQLGLLQRFKDLIKWW